MVGSLIKKSASVLSLKQTNILGAAVVIMATVIFSAVLGLIRIRLLSGFFGDSRVLDVYWAAFRLPDMLFQLLVMGALSSAFIPVFSSFLGKDDKKSAFQVANTVITGSLFIFLLFLLLVFIFTKEFCHLLAPGFSDMEIILMVKLTRIMLAAQALFIVGNFLTGMLQSFHRFLLPALAPIFYNIGIIIGTVLFSRSFGILGPTYGVVIGTLLFFLIQLPLVIKLGWRFIPSFNFRSQGVSEVVKLMAPRTLSLGVTQIEYTTDLMIASLFAPGHYTVFTFALFLISLPVRLFGATIGQASLPSLSLNYARENIIEFKKTFLNSLGQIIYLILPASIILLVLRVPLVRLAFGSKSFSWDATLLTGNVVAFLTVAIISQSLTQLLIRAFYAFHDTKTPFYIGVFSVTVNVVTSLVFALYFKLGVVGLAISSSVSSFVNAFLLFIYIREKIGDWDREYTISFFKKIFSTIIMAVFLYVFMRILDLFVFDTRKTINLIFLTIITLVIGSVSYLAASFFLKIEEAKAYLDIFRKIRNWRSVLTERKEIIETTSPTSQS